MVLQHALLPLKHTIPWTLTWVLIKEVFLWCWEEPFSPLTSKNVPFFLAMFWNCTCKRWEMMQLVVHVILLIFKKVLETCQNLWVYGRSSSFCFLVINRMIYLHIVSSLHQWLAKCQMSVSFIELLWKEKLVLQSYISKHKACPRGTLSDLVTTEINQIII